MTQAPPRPATALALPLSRGEAGGLAPSPRVLTALARADGVAAPLTLADYLFTQFGVADAARRPGIAALTALADGVAAHGRAVLRLDPVHLRPDRGRLFLVDAGRFALSGEEADAMIAALNEICLPEDTTLLRGRSARRWYLVGGDAAAASGIDPAAASGASVDDLEPGGAATLAWHRTVNEMQMCLHELPVNARREAAGQPPVNSVWLWGAGAAPADLPPRFDTVVAGEPLAAGLGIASGARVIDDVATGMVVEGDTLIVAGAGEAAAALDAAIDAHSRGGGRALTVWMPGCLRRLTRAGRFRFWRRARPLIDYLAGEDDENTAS